VTSKRLGKSMIVQQLNELELLWMLHRSGQIDDRQQNLLCCDNAAYNAFVNGAFYRIRDMKYRLPLFWYAEGKIMALGQDNCGQPFPVIGRNSVRCV